MENLKKWSLRIEDGAQFYSSIRNETEVISLSENLASKFNGCYAVNNSTIAFFIDGEFYVTPYTSEAIRVLKTNGFQEKSFYVPLSNGEIPIEIKTQGFWQGLKEAASSLYKKEFIADCEKWCDDHHIRAISEEHLKDCFRMPDSGVPVRLHCYEDIYYPICDSLMLNAFVEGKLGRFGRNNGKVVFVYRDGNTYVAKGYGIVKYLKSAGFQEIGLFVPFSNNEEIIDSRLKYQWESIPKKR